MMLRPPISTLFPYTTLFRSLLGRRLHLVGRRPERGQPHPVAVAGVRLRIRRRAAAPVHRGRRRPGGVRRHPGGGSGDRKSTRLNSSHVKISYAVFCLKKKKI